MWYLLTTETYFSFIPIEKTHKTYAWVHKTQDKDKPNKKHKQNNTAHYVMDTTMHKQLEVKTNWTSFYAEIVNMWYVLTTETYFSFIPIEKTHKTYALF
jgi:hypothetical protein